MASAVAALLVVVAVVGVGAAVVAVAVAAAARRRSRDLAAQVTALREASLNAASGASASFERLQGALCAVDDGVVVTDPAGEIVIRNDAAEGFLDRASGGALVASAVERVIAEVVGREAGATVDEPVELFGPPRRSLVIHGASLRARDGDRLGALVRIEDVSVRRHLDAMRRDFVANMSHELKTPVGALGLLAETILDETDPAIVRRLAERMQDEAMRVNRIIEDLLDLSRIESEEIDVDATAPVSIHAVVTEAVGRLDAAAERQRVAIGVLPVPQGTMVAGDHRQLVSAVHSLLENAITYTEAGGDVRVGVSDDGRWVRVSVADTGVGIPARDLDRIFERFYRVDRARARATGGTGLGLAIVRHVAQNHGGAVHVQSQEGVGSTFTLELPSVSGSLPAPPVRAQETVG